MKKVIVHVSEVDIHPNSGMSRVEYHWQKAFGENNVEFLHIGPKEVGHLPHKAFFPLKAYLFFKKLKIKPVAFIIHEPAATFFVNKKCPVFLESHGIERRAWEDETGQKQTMSIKTKLLYPIWRLWQCDRGLRKAHKLLLINSDDRKYAVSKYKRNREDIYLFENGTNLDPAPISSLPHTFTILFNGSWIRRKGTDTLVEAAKALHKNGRVVTYLLIGTGAPATDVLKDWPEELHGNIIIVSRFNSEEESLFLNRASVVVLPSQFEGQPLSILQAMAAGKCCITTNCCGQKDFIVHEKNGLLFNPGNVPDFVSLIEACCDNPDLIMRIGAEAKASMKNRNWQEVSNNLVTYVMNNL